MNDFYINMGLRIKAKRKKLGLTRDELALLANISDKFLYDVEVGNKGVSAFTLFKIAKSLNVSTDWLLEGNPRNK